MNEIGLDPGVDHMRCHEDEMERWENALFFI
jgi:hypothetical protein